MQVVNGMKPNIHGKRNVLQDVTKWLVSRQHVSAAVSLIETQLQVGHALMGLECDA